MNVNYYDLPLHKLHEAESRMDRSVMIVGFSANDLAEPNVFTGDYLYGLRDPKAMLGSLKNILFDCVRRYRSNRDKLPQSVTIMLTVRDCHEKFKVLFICRFYVFYLVIWLFRFSIMNSLNCACLLKMNLDLLVRFT